MAWSDAARAAALAARRAHGRGFSKTKITFPKRGYGALAGTTHKFRGGIHTALKRSEKYAELVHLRKSGMRGKATVLRKKHRV